MTDLNDLPGHLIRRMNQISVAIFAARMAEAGVEMTPVQYAALSVVRDNPGIDQATLAGLIAHDRVTIGGVVDRLQTKGLLSRSVSRQDRRARELQITEAGAALLDNLLPGIREVQDRILSGLTEAERRIFVELLRRAAEAGNELSRAPLRQERAAE